VREGVGFLSVHVSNILARLGVSGHVEAAAFARRLGITAQRNHQAECLPSALL
jgi:hypothetical protein